MTFGLGPKTTTALIVTAILAVVTMAVWAIVPPNISGVTVEPILLGEDEFGNVVTLGDSGLLSTVSYPNIKKIKIGAKGTVTLVGMASTEIQWWLDYRYQVKGGTYDDWEGGWSSDSGWAPYWKTWFSINDGASFDFEPEKKAWWYINHWEYRYSDGWMVLDPTVYDSVGDWIKWSGGLGEDPPSGDYTCKISLHVKVNYKDNNGEEHCAIGPPEVKPASAGPAMKSGELIDFLTFTLNYEAGSMDITITPEFQYKIWVPLDFAQTLQPSMMLSISDVFAVNNLPTWLPHALLTTMTIGSGIATVYYYIEEE